MCGIGGIIKLSTGARSPLPAELGFMTDVLRHRVLPSYEATAEGWDGAKLVDEVLRRVPVP